MKDSSGADAEMEREFQPTHLIRKNMVTRTSCVLMADRADD